MKRTLLLISVFCLVIACDRYPDPAYEFLKNYMFVYQNAQGQRFLEGEFVNDSVSIMASNNANQDRERIKIKFDVIKGGGNVTLQEVYTNSYSIASTKWQLGSESTDQILRATSYDQNGKYLTSSDLLAYGFRSGEWNRWSGSPDGQMTGIVADTVNKITFMIANAVVYRQGNPYYSWVALTDPLIETSRSINIDSNGVIYVSTWEGDVVRSTDHGQSWHACTKPYPDRTAFIYLSVSNDNFIWVFDFDHPTRFSGDGGITWTDAGGGIESIGYGDVFRLKDGSLLIHGSNCCSLNRSSDEGHTWTPVTTPGYSIKLYVNEKDEIFIVTQENGITIYKSINYGLTFNQVYNVHPEFSTSMGNTFNNRGSFYYVLIPGYGILKSADLTYFDDYYLNKNLIDLFIDQNGVLIAKDQDYQTVYYRENLNSD